MHAFNLADYSILSIIALSGLIGSLRGFIKEALSLIIWGASFFIAFKFCTLFGDHYLTSRISSNSVRMATAFIVLFGATFILGSILSYAITHLIVKDAIKGPDRALGMLFGLARGILVVAVLLLLFSMGLTEKRPWQKESYLVPKFDEIVNLLQTVLPSKIQKVK